MEAATVISSVSQRNAQAAQLAEATRGEFEVLDQLGVGAMGSVYLARDTALSRHVAIKVIASNLLQDDSMVARFRQEAQTVASLRHPNIVNVHAVREADSLHYFVMDYIDGPPLRTIIKAHAPLAVPVVQALLYQVGSALDYAHHRGKGVIHRDIKPANIMVDRGGDAFVTDFGISKIAESQTGLTQTGATIGTPEYMSPEQCRGEDLTGASDQYALGVVAYEMLCGRTPFSGSQYHIMVAHTSEEPTPILSVRPDCPPHVAEAVHRMLGKSPGDRFPDLESAVTTMGGAPLSRKDPVRSHITVLTGPQTVVAGDATTVITGNPEVGTAKPNAPAAQAQSPSGPGATGGDRSITVLGLPARVEVGDSFRLSADVRAGAQGSIPGASVAWSSTDPAVVRVDGGVIQAVATGSAIVSASFGGVSGQVSLHVLEAAPAAIFLEPGALHMESGDRTSVRARVEDRHGHALDRPIRWLTSDARVASVNRDGEIVATGEGRALLTAETGGVTASADVVVAAGTGTATRSTPPAARYPTSARRGQRKAPLVAALLVFVVSLGAFGAYRTGVIGQRTLAPDESSGQASLPPDPLENGAGPAAGVSDPIVANGTPPEAGRPTPAAGGPAPGDAGAGDEQPLNTGGSTAEGSTAGALQGPSSSTGAGTQAPPPSAAGTAPTPSPQPSRPAPTRQPTTLRMRVTTPTMVLGTAQSITWDVLDQNGGTLSSALPDVSVRSLDEAVVTVDLAAGRLLAVGAGTADVEARLGTLREAVRVTVEAPVQIVRIDGGDRDLEVGALARLTAIAVGPGGTPIPGATATWSSSDPNVVAVAGGGAIRGRAPGTADIVAQVDGVEGRIRVTVTAAEAAGPAPAQAARLIGTYIALLSSGDRDAVTALHGAEGPEQLAELLRMMGSNGFGASLENGESLEAGGATFAVALRTRSSFGGRRDTTRRFFATFAQAGRQWRLASVVMLPE